MRYVYVERAVLSVPVAALPREFPLRKPPLRNPLTPDRLIVRTIGV
jgi:hypothetical protein